MSTSRTIAADLAPAGRLRASINLGNPILAGRRPDGELFGVSVDLAQELAHRLALPLDLTPYDAAGKAVDALRAGDVDIGFFAIDPKRSEGIAFTPPYVLIEGAYLVRDDSPVTRNEDVDRPGTRVVVGAGSAYDLFLSRELKHATIVRSPTSPGVIDLFMEGAYEVAAGVKPQLASERRRHPATRLLPTPFMVIQQAMGAPDRITTETRRFLTAFIEEMKRSGTVASLLAKHGIEGATVAPGAPAS